ncbi:DUF3047 domain-containing protein [Gammaproteobacteria bacterium AB-CW1]|uniref:DUF3047 domain-containing protein n=1 Tax=Natronospira elongata TaxID=3110268 RepID=A0AAP6JJ64_9GAMM|nr:DUF3047 domain-containing protein [Gammaproteobacteria bacterium AB-CW1]
MNRRMAWLTVFIPLPLLAAPDLEFPPAEIIDWDREVFEGETAYRLVEMEDREAIHALCESSASALYLEQEIDLRETPIIEWSWRIRGSYGEDIDESSREGDDYPVRLYAISDGGWRRWQTRAVNWVWASGKDQGESWPSAYADQVKMVALQSGEEKAGQWVTERRNIREDFARFHDREIETIDAIGLMSDCDDLDTSNEAWFGGIRLLPAEADD